MSTLVLHCNWSGGLLHLWAEDSRLSVAQAAAERGHPFVAAPEDLRERLALPAGAASELTLMLPVRGTAPAPSTLLCRSLGLDEDAIALELAGPEPFPVRSFAVPAEHALDALRAAEDVCEESSLADEAGDGLVLIAGPSLRFFAAAARLAQHLLAQQRFVPCLVQIAGDLRGSWQPWLSDEATSAKVASLIRAIPPSARCAVDGHNHEPWPIVESFLLAVTDAACRASLTAERFVESVEEREDTDPHVAWLKGLLDSEPAVKGPQQVRTELTRRVRSWIGLLEERGASSAWRLLLRLNEPPAPIIEALDAAAAKQGAARASVREEEWTISFHLQSVEKPDLVLDASDIWLLTADSVTIQGRRLDSPQELLLGELGRATRVYKRLEEALSESEPSALTVTSRQAYEFLREVRPILLEQGFGVQAPEWWESPAARLGAKLRLDGGDIAPGGAAAGGGAALPRLGLGTLVKYHWEISVGDTTLSLQEFEQLAARRAPLVRLNGRWVEIRPEDVQAAIRFIRENPGGEMQLGEALRMAYVTDPRETGVQVVGLEATGWLQGFLSSDAGGQKIEMLETPATFRGTLRPYQARGLSWLAFQERLGFGVCLADDMGLGKTIQLLALLAHEREASKDGHVLPTLLLVPMSVVGNWMHETARFCPHLRVVVHHGLDRLQGEAFITKVKESDLVISTYSLAHRDRELLGDIDWGRIVLDEAQYIKNPTAKQSQAARAFKAERRAALTGTPVENRLTELWSIMDFLNPGYLGGAASFRTNFAVPIERYHDKSRAEKLRSLIRPFVLRRLKTDPTVVSDLPEKLESKEFAHLTGEQAALYESCVRRMLTEVDQAEGMQRRGLVLAALVRLKQICDHPALALKEERAGPVEPGRSGKCIRLLEMLDEVLAEGDQSLIFTQFREMGELLAPMLRHHLGRDVLFLHGGTPQAQRQQMIDLFQKADGTHPILLLSLKAGGVGLNLTAATHVFHFDRWWNPAVENQATDRAYRIGQTRTVQVHKFVCRGTLEERIDQMIESKTELAENIIGSGEQWITELDSGQLRDILTLRNDAVDDVA